MERVSGTLKKDGRTDGRMSERTNEQTNERADDQNKRDKISHHSNGKGFSSPRDPTDGVSIYVIELHDRAI